MAETSIGPLHFSGDAPVGQEVLLGFRPECLSVVEGPPGGRPNTFRATLQTTTFLGDQFVYWAAANGDTLIGKSRTHVMAHEDGHLHLQVSPSEVLVFEGAQRTGVHVIAPDQAAIAAVAESAL
jgi:hypothetical protein